MKTVMKTQEQVLRYASICRFPDADWQKVLDYCRNNYGGGKAHKAQKPISNSTYEEFIQWIDCGYGPGDIVRYGHTLGMVGASTPDRTYLIAYLSFEGELVVRDMEVFPYKLFRSDSTEAERFNGIVRQHNFEFSTSLSSLVPSYVPSKGDFVALNANGATWYGIFRQSDGDDNYFYALVKDGVAYKDMAVSVVEATMSLPSREQMIKIQAALSASRLEWNARLMVLTDVVDIRAGVRGKYWYITDRFKVCTDKDMHTKLHDDRYKNGNYFPSLSDALLFLQKLQELRQEMKIGLK